MVAPIATSARVTADGKFFRLGGKKFHLKGVSYGPFAADGGEGTFASPEQTARYFAQLRELGASLIRVYYFPPRNSRIWAKSRAVCSGLAKVPSTPSGANGPYETPLR